MAQDYCSVKVRTDPSRPVNHDPLGEYVPKGYASDKALDAAVSLTASAWGPPFASDYDGAEWWMVAYTFATEAVEAAIVTALSLEDADGRADR